jgi:rubrerythrin
MPHLVSSEELSRDIATLTSLELSDAPFTSCYLNLEQGHRATIGILKSRAAILEKIMPGDDAWGIWEAVYKIESFLDKMTLPGAKGLAFFHRSVFGGEFILPMQFAVPVPTLLVSQSMPHLFPLMKLKKQHQRYIVVHTNNSYAAIFEVDLGAITAKALRDHPAAHDYMGPGLSRYYFQIHRDNRGQLFYSEKIRILRHLFQSGGHTRLVVAGDQEMVDSLLLALPEDLRRFLALKPIFSDSAEAEAIAATIDAMLIAEHQAAKSLLAIFLEHLSRDEMAVAGTAATYQAILDSNVDAILISENFTPKAAWICPACSQLATDATAAELCPSCGMDDLKLYEMREALLRLAGQRQCRIELVESSLELDALEGVGCLLRRPST